MTRHAAMLAVTALPFLVGACDLLVIQAELEEVCVIGMQIEVEGLPVAGTFETELVEEGVELPLPEGLDPDVRLRSVILAVTEGSDSLRHLEAVRIGMQAQPDAALPAVSLIDFHATAEHDRDSLLIDGDGLVNLTDYLRQQELRLDVALTGTLPEQSWTLELDLCFRAAAEYRHAF